LYKTGPVELIESRHVVLIDATGLPIAVMLGLKLQITALRLPIVKEELYAH
jgi:hypothetical protein